MRWKTTLLLLMAVIGLGAYISLYELHRPLPDERAQLDKRILAIEPDSINQITLEVPQASITLTNSAGGWTAAPQGVRADPSRISRILGQLSSLTAERILAPPKDQPMDLKPFGLEPPAGRLMLAGSGTSHTLLFGEATSVASNRYAKLLNRPEVFVLASTLFDEVNQPLEQFRDPLLIRIGEWALNAVSIASADATYTLIRADQRWQLGPPINDAADRAELSTLLHQLSEIMIKRFIADAPQSDKPGAHGFDRPRAEVRLEREDPDGTVTLAFGAALPDNPSLIYAKRSDEPAVYAVALSDLEPLLQSPGRLRAKSPFEFFTNTVMRVAITENNTTRWAIARKDGRWFADGSEAPLEAPPVETFLNQLADLRVSGFVDAPSTDLARYGLTRPAGVISVWTLNVEQPQSLTVGAALEDGAERYGQIEGRAVLIMLPAAIADLLATPLDRFRKQTP